MSGTPPFYSYTSKPGLSPGMIRRIKSADYEFDADSWKVVSPEAKNLVELLLNPDPKARITIENVFKHTWMKVSRKHILLSICIEFYCSKRKLSCHLRH